MKYLLLKLLILLILLSPGCGIWENFTTYFNLYYNTVDIFEQAEEAIYLQERSIFATEEIVVPANANQLLNKVVEKTSKILQFHGTTSYIDDALIMLGKSFYYQRNYLKAVRKFQELTATQKESNLYLEAVLWTAKSQMRLREFDNALNTLDSLKIIAAAEEDDEILTQAYIEEVTYYVSRENYADAIKSADELLKVADDDAQKAEILYETGNFYLKLKEPENAIRYFEMVNDYSPEYEVQFNTFLERGRTLRNLERNKEALAVFEEMRLEDKYRDDFDIVDYEIGMTYLKLGQLNEAIENLVYVDTSYATSTYSGLARYNLGKIYENEIINYDSAANYYQKAAASQLPQENVREVHNKNQLFIKYKNLAGKIAQTKGQLYYIDNPDKFVEDSAAYYDSLEVLTLNQQQQDSLLGGNEEQRTGRNTGRLNEQGFPKTKTNAQGNPPVRPTIPRDSLEKIFIVDKFNLANLFYAEMEKPDSAAKYYFEILNDTSASEFHSRSMYAIGNYYLVKGDSVKADSIFNYIYDNYKNESVVNAAALQLKKPLIDLDFDPAEDIYVEAEKLWMQENYDSALALYERVFKEFPESPLAPKALLASGFILENDLRIPDSAAAVYDSITVKYPGSTYAAKINPKVIAYKQEKARIQREIEDSLRAANIKTDSLGIEEKIVSPDSLTEVEKLQMEMEKSLQEKEIKAPADSLKIQEIKPDTLQPQQHQQQNNERRNPRRRR